MKIKRLTAFMLACVLSFCAFSAFLTPVSAQDTGTITILANTGDNGEVQSLAGKKFNVYQIFSAENSLGLESINYTMNPLYEDALKAEKRKNTEYAIIDYIQTLNNHLVINDVTHTQNNESTYSDFRYFVENLRNEIVKDGAAPTKTVTVPKGATSSYTFDVMYGWYIVDEVTSVEGTHSAASLCMVNTSNPDFEVQIKSDFPVVQKQIREDDNRTSIGNDKDGWNDVADYEIGQTVPYRFNSYVPNINGYSSYYFAFHDKMDEALTFNPSSVTVKVGSITLTKDVDYRVVTTNLPDGETFQVVINDLKAVINKYYYSNEANAKPETEKVYGQKVVVEYNATLNEKAQSRTGRAGFENDVKLEYSNNPDSDGVGSTGDTPWDTVVCFTFRMNGIKVNDQTPERRLMGAKFRLYSDADCTEEVYVKKASEGDGYTVINRDSVTGTGAPAEAVEMESDAQGIFNIIGLDSQVYYLKETKAPPGYRLLKDPIKITVSATYGADNRLNYTKGDGATNKTLQTLSAKAHFKEFYAGAYNEYDSELATTVENGTLNLKVVNQVGSKLPATGSSMTLALVISGTAIMTGVLIRKKRERKAKAE